MYVYEACHTICPLLPRKRENICLYGVHKFPILNSAWELYFHLVLHLWCMTRLNNSPSLLQHAASNQSCPKVMTVTTGIICTFFFQCGCFFVFLSMLPWNLFSSCLVRVNQVHSELFFCTRMLKRVSTLGLFQQHANAHACVHTITPTGWSCLLFYCYMGSGVVGVDGC